MVKYLENKRVSQILIIVSFLTYTIIGLTRNAYSAAIVGIISEGYFSKSDAGIIATSFSITYCISQIVGSYYVDRVSPFKIIVLGSVVTIFANVAMSLSPTYWTIFIARGVCGIAQFGVWPALLRILSEYVNKDHRHAWRYILPLGVSLGYVFSYIGAAVVSHWKGLFTLSYIAMAVATVVFIITSAYADKKAVIKEEVKPAEKTTSENIEKISLFKMFATSGALLLIIPILAKSVIGVAIASWMPTMIMESYNVSPAISSIMTTLTTCANFVAVLWVIIIYPKIFKMQTNAVGMLFLFTIPFVVVSAMFIGSMSMIWIVIFITLVNSFMGSIHQFNTVEIPGAYTRYNKAGMVAGLINAIGTFASILSSWLWGAMAEVYSWNTIIATWAVMALVSAICCFLATPLWKKFVRGK